VSRVVKKWMRKLVLLVLSVIEGSVYLAADVQAAAVACTQRLVC
jgi:hypothetical protein